VIKKTSAHISGQAVEAAAEPLLTPARADSARSDGTAALDKALDVLDAVGSSANGLSQAELGERLDLPRTTLYRLLGTLVARDLLRRDPLRRVYCLGMRCFDYARKAYSMPDLVAAAGIELRALRDMTGETTYLATLDGLEVLSLERCDGAHSVRSHSEPGSRKPLHCTSQGHPGRHAGRAA
jgi:IclR family transcriptional regulator, acetate operon repressor